MKRDNNKVSHIKDDVTMIEFEDGDILIISTKHGFIEVATYTSNTKGVL